ncbi:MAG: GGDEF domain-containing protein [Proteobacteria bacterium]|nr:GGDEF domain-containing protein [Pseudomonadota bacterium]MBU1965441.1 GGDEF domain-containing protein [Pseudomonadota bacterium]
MMETFSREELKKIKLFRLVDIESIQGILDACTFRSLTAGEVLITTGQQNRTVYFLLEGNVRIHLSSLQSEPTATLGPGESIGEMSVIDHQPTSAFVVAAEPVRLLAMDEELLWSLVQSSHAAACNLLIGLSTRLRHADAVISQSNEMEMEVDCRHYGTVDALTGLHNRFWMDMVLERQVQRSITGGLPLSLILIDIDNFKIFNDRCGRAYGEHVLYSMAHTLSDHLRPTEIVARYGGDEFVVILPDVAIETAMKIGGRLHRGVMDAIPVTPNGSSIPHPTISIGLAALKAGQMGKELLAEAERALGRAKSGGRNRISE